MAVSKKAGNREDFYKKFTIILIGIAFVVDGASAIIRTYCTLLPGGLHPSLIHTCLELTAPLQYLGGVAIVVIGIFIIFIDRIIDWMFKSS